MVLKRFVKGIDQEAFFQKRVPENHPDFIDTATLHYARGTSAEEAVIRDAAGLAWVINLGCLDLNPHPVRAEDLDHPDELRVDPDPMPGVDWSQIVDVATSPARCSMTWAWSAGRRPQARAVCTSWCASHRSGTSARCGSRPRPSPAKSRTGRRGSRQRAGGRRSAARACSSTSTRTRRTAPWPRPTRSALPDARVSTPLDWDEVRTRRPEEFTALTVPPGSPRSATRTRASTTRPARSPRCWRSRKSSARPRSRRAAATARGAARRRCRSSRSPARRPSPRPSTRLEQWKVCARARGRDAAPADTMVDGMRGASSALVPRAHQPAARARGRSAGAGRASRGLRSLGW